VIGFSFLYWGLYVLFGLAILRHARYLAERDGNFMHHDPMSTMSEGWTFMFLAIMGLCNSMREALIAIEHQCSLIVMELIQALLYCTAGVTLLTGPWTLESHDLNTVQLVSVSEMMSMLSVILGVTHVVVGFMRPRWRAEAARVAETQAEARAESRAEAQAGNS